jgi:hypothetical protein
MQYVQRKLHRSVTLIRSISTAPMDRGPVAIAGNGVVELVHTGNSMLGF